MNEKESLINQRGLIIAAGESGFPSEFLGKYCSVLRRGTG